MNDVLTNLVIWLYVHETAVTVSILVITIMVVWQLLRLLYARPITQFLDRQQALIAGGGLLLLILLPTPVMSLMRPDISTTTLIGRGLYQNHCRQCHGDKGNRLPSIPLGAKEFLDSLGDATLVSVVREGKGVMPAWGQAHEGPLADDEVVLIVRYLKEVATAGGPGAVVKPTAKPSAAAGAAATSGEGKDLYAKQCAACHGPTGDHLPVANLASREYLRTKEAGLARAIAEGKGGMPGFADKLSTAQITMVVGFLRAQAGLTDAAPAAAGTATAGKALYEKSCQGCHGPDGNQLPTSQLGAKDFLGQRQDAELVTTVLQGKGTMPGFGSAKGGALSEAEARDVVAYLRSLAP